MTPASSGAPAPAGKGTEDLASVLAALEKRCSGADGPGSPRRARAHRRGFLTLVLVALLIGGVIELFTLTPELRPTADGGSRASVVFSNAQSGTCLSWPPDAPDKPSFVQCRSDHMFEVAKPVGMSSFNEPCQLAVREYLGTRYDPNSRFTISVLWAGDADGTNASHRNLLCGLQLLGSDGKPIPFKGRIVELDQSKTWPAGTCLGLDSADRSTDIPVDCAAPHGLEVTGAVGLAERFTGAAPSDSDQRAFIGEACTRTADAYLAPATLTGSGLTIGYETIAPASWAAGSRQVSCGVGKPAQQGWVSATGSARTRSPADLPASPVPAAAPAPAAPPAPAPSPSAAPPPPVYEEPLIPVGPIPTEAPAVPQAPNPGESPAPATTTTATAAPTTTTPPGPAPALGPAPGPATPPSETSTGPPPGIVEIPGLPPITLPGYVPPEPAQPAPPD